VAPEIKAGPNVHNEFYFSDFRETDGIRQWRTVEWFRDGQPGGRAEVTSVRFLTEVDEQLLNEP
jgi:hypothetical protein